MTSTEVSVGLVVIGGVVGNGGVFIYAALEFCTKLVFVKLVRIDIDDSLPVIPKTGHEIFEILATSVYRNVLLMYRVLIVEQSMIPIMVGIILPLPYPPLFPPPPRGGPDAQSCRSRGQAARSYRYRCT